jgi:hypothetical protein
VAKRIARTAAGAIPVAAALRLGMPAFGALVLLAVLILAVACWVIGSQARTDRVSQLLLARRGTITPPSPAALPARPTVLKRTLKMALAARSMIAR